MCCNTLDILRGLRIPAPKGAPPPPSYLLHLTIPQLLAYYLTLCPSEVPLERRGISGILRFDAHIHKCHNKSMKFSDDQIQQLKELMNTMFDKKLKPIKRKLNSIEKDLKWTMLRYDTRLVHLENHFSHPPGRADN